MGRPYSLELEELGQTYEWAADCSIHDLTEAIRSSSHFPFLSIGSGGSLTVAAYWSMVHEEWTGMPAKHGTPIDLFSLPSTSNYAIGLVSARGSNPDIVKAFESATQDESKRLVAITLYERSKLNSLAKIHPWTRVISFRPPIGRDGFLATNSLLCFMVLLHRAYAAAAGTHVTLPASLPEPKITLETSELETKTYSILYAGWAATAALDLESKLVEGGLSDVHYADLRNFAHGRHHWLARRGKNTTVVAIVTPKWSKLMNRTIDLLPPHTRIIRIESSNDGPLGAIELAIGILRLVGQIASRQQFDPGRPSIPAFGRRLYHMGPKISGRRRNRPSTDLILSRKFRSPTARWTSPTVSGRTQAMIRYLEILKSTTYTAIVFDYDETLCPSANRFGQLPDDISLALNRIVDHEVVLGIASGRGRSVGQALRKTLDQKVWQKVIVGYYNGGCVQRLSEGDPPTNRQMHPELSNFFDLVRKHPQLVDTCQIEPRPYQISLIMHPGCSLVSAMELILELLSVNRPPGICITRSSHSIDILGPGVSKLSVVQMCSQQLADTTSSPKVLRIGDSGTWSGNDLQLLSDPLSLSVAACPLNSSWAWNLAAPGHIGPQATLDYLSVMDFQHGSFSLNIDRLVGKL